MKSLMLIVLASALALLAGCSTILPHSNTYTLYQLPAHGAPAAGAHRAPTVDWQLRVDTPEAQRILSGARIVVVPEAGKISTYHGGRWVQRIPSLLRDRLIEAFHASGRVHGVSSDESALDADFELDSTLDAFQAEYRGGKTPTVVVRLDARLLRAGGRHILASKRFVVSEPASGAALDAVVAAFGRAADQLSRDVVAWTFAQAQRQPPAEP